MLDDVDEIIVLTSDEMPFQIVAEHTQVVQAANRDALDETVFEVDDEVDGIEILVVLELVIEQIVETDELVEMEITVDEVVVDMEILEMVEIDDEVM